MRWQATLCLGLAVGAVQACGPEASPPKLVVRPVPTAEPVTEACTVKNPPQCEDLCQRGDPRSCSNLGVLLVDDGLGVGKDPVRAASLFQRACDAGELNACTNLASMLLRGLAGEADAARAGVLFERACRGGVAEACTDRGMLQVATDPSAAAVLFERACATGSARACNHLGTLHLEGLGVSRDLSRAMTLFSAACEQGYPDGCNGLGLMRMDQVPPDPVAAARLFERGCDMGSGDACISLGGMALRGTSPVSQDHELAHRLFLLACERGSASGCFNVALMYQRSLATAPEGDSARQRYEEACRLGHEGGCAELQVH